ncbi:MAG: tetratricopeptide repeat protein [Ignavibacteriaceae bacterium]|nr:tetratricopeptide repeat protein [Ignavibacteriaceae bacterium]
MENNKQEFQTDIDSLLNKFLNEAELQKFNDKIVQGETNNKTLGIINDFYNRQLKVDYGFIKERMEIDRAITFANKNLDKKRFVQLLMKLGQVCTSHGKLNLAYEVINKAVKESVNPKDRAESLLLLSDIHSRRAEWLVSIEILNEAKKIFEAFGDIIGVAKCENMLGSIFGERGELEEAKAHFINSLICWNSGEDKEMAAIIEGNLGIIENIQGNYDDALDYFCRALEKLEVLGSYRRIAEIKHNVGMLYVHKNELEKALLQFDQCINISLKENLLPVLSTTYLSKANVLIKMGDYDAALVFADKSMEIAHQIDDKLTIADVYRTRSSIEIQFKNYEKAENYLLTSLTLNEKLKNILNMAETCLQLGKLYELLSITDKKEEYLLRSLKYYREANASESIQKLEEMLENSI